MRLYNTKKREMPPKKKNVPVVAPRFRKFAGLEGGGRTLVGELKTKKSTNRLVGK